MVMLIWIDNEDELFVCLTFVKLCNRKQSKCSGWRTSLMLHSSLNPIKSRDGPKWLFFLYAFCASWAATGCSVPCAFLRKVLSDLRQNNHGDFSASTCPFSWQRRMGSTPQRSIPSLYNDQIVSSSIVTLLKETGSHKNKNKTKNHQAIKKIHFGGV